MFSLHRPSGLSNLTVKRSYLWRYGSAVLGVAIALIVTLLLKPLLYRTPTPLFFVAVIFILLEQEQAARTLVEQSAERVKSLQMLTDVTIARYLTELHGGTIEATSGGVGEGAIFTVKLPLVEKVGD